MTMSDLPPVRTPHAEIQEKGIGHPPQEKWFNHDWPEDGIVLLSPLSPNPGLHFLPYIGEEPLHQPPHLSCRLDLTQSLPSSVKFISQISSVPIGFSLLSSPKLIPSSSPHHLLPGCNSHLSQSHHYPQLSIP